ncbi:hypothetical protein M2404_003475 [Rheinheimera pacifica]|uniref:hypothetical protein n=1 Tax=Rheinheimera pacifica TaxID=173990 RepID=UPI0021696B0F|nr:hypothetical protein [Rheinheimera pacifica]MCS4309112.1 hypothetical protein [Rheinheimera pacifica]
MSWIHTGKTQAFNYTGLDKNLAQEHGIRLPAQYFVNKWQLTHQALLMLASLNDYDQQQVMKEIEYVTRYPSTTYSTKHSLNPFRRIYRTRYPFRSYHYLIEYRTAANGQVVIDEIFFDKTLTGENVNSAAERTMLYHVGRDADQHYDSAKNHDEIRGLVLSAPKFAPTNQVRTEHAAVNGMQNNLNKAAWLMGVHAQAAYSSDTISAYTLFHNPTDGGMLDLTECLFDKLSRTKSHNAQHLAAVLAQAQQQGKAVKWVAHSQGAIIFNAALVHYRAHYGGRLGLQQLAVHGSGANVERLINIATGLGMKITDVRNNPFDLVPNLAGGNNLSPSSLCRSLKFCGLVFGPNSGPGVSPHTLPYLGIETYRQQLWMMGNHKKAAQVQRYIQIHAGKVR